MTSVESTAIWLQWSAKMESNPPEYCPGTVPSCCCSAAVMTGERVLNPCSFLVIMLIYCILNAEALWCLVLPRLLWIIAQKMLKTCEILKIIADLSSACFLYCCSLFQWKIALCASGSVQKTPGCSPPLLSSSKVCKSICWVKLNQIYKIRELTEIENNNARE